MVAPSSPSVGWDVNDLPPGPRSHWGSRSTDRSFVKAAVSALSVNGRSRRRVSDGYPRRARRTGMLRFDRSVLPVAVPMHAELR